MLFRSHLKVAGKNPRAHQCVHGSIFMRKSNTYPLAGLTLVTLTTALIAHPATDGWLEPSLVQATVRKRLAERGWITLGGNTRLVGAATDYLRHCVWYRNSSRFPPPWRVRSCNLAARFDRSGQERIRYGC